MTRRPRLLFLARPFPPAKAVASLRTWNIAKYLARSGWDVTVVTPRPDVWRQVEPVDEAREATLHEGVRRIETDHGWRFLMPARLNAAKSGPLALAGSVCRKIASRLEIDPNIGWIKPTKVACAPLRPGDADVVLATGPPFVSFRLARSLSHRLGCPYVLDYRDPWSGNPHMVRPSRRDEALESGLVAGAAALTVVSPSWGHALEQQFDVGAKLHVVTNGFDPETMREVRPFDFDHFAIVYAGNFYPPKRTIAPVLSAMARLDELVGDSSPDWRFHYYGRSGVTVIAEAERLDVRRRVVLHGTVGQGAAFSAVRGAGVVVVVTSVLSENALADRGIVPAKLYEAIGLGAPILLIAPEGADARTIAEHSGSASSFSGTDDAGIAACLADRIGGKRVTFRDPGRYDWRRIVLTLDRVLRDAASVAGARSRD